MSFVIWLWKSHFLLQNQEGKTFSQKPDKSYYTTSIPLPINRNAWRDSSAEERYWYSHCHQVCERCQNWNQLITIQYSMKCFVMKQLLMIFSEMFSCLSTSERGVYKMLVFVFERLVPSPFFGTPDFCGCKQQHAHANQVLCFSISEIEKNVLATTKDCS